ncbi:MAG: hypothetical protein QW063_02405 [Candidatus Nanoarchaeia archaeon]
MSMLTAWELVQIIVTIVAVGFIFSGRWHKPHPIEYGIGKKETFWDSLRCGIAIAAPAIIMHEMAHKFLALGYGLSASYAASWWGLSVGIALKFLAPGFIFFIPGYVLVTGTGTALQFGLVALAGPLTNLILFGLFWFLAAKDVAPEYSVVWQIGKQINLWLFVFNMLPIPGLDGFKFYTSIWQTFT